MPATPTIVAHMGTSVGGDPINIHTVFVDGGKAYLANTDLGLEIYDVADPAAPVRLGEVRNPTASGDVFLHDLSVQGPRAYLNFWAAGMVIADVSTPTAPTVVGTFANYGETSSHSNWVTQVGARCEFQFTASPPRNGSEAGAAMDSELEQALHLALLNRGVMITPFHNMLLVSPHTQAADAEPLAQALAAFIAELRA